MPGRDIDTAIRVVHDLTQSVWLGGALMGAVALDAAASTAADQPAQVRGVDRAWSRWHRVSTPAIGAHLAAGLGLTLANRGRLAAQAGGARTTAIRTTLTGLALVTETASRRIGRTIGAQAASTDASAGPVDVDEDLVALRRKLAVAQWANVAATAAMVAVGSRMGEQQRPRELARGLARRLHLAA